MPLNHPETIPLPDLWEKSSSTKSVPGTKKKVGELLLYKALFFFFFPIPSLPTEAEGIISPALQMTELGQKDKQFALRISNWLVLAGRLELRIDR